MSNDPIICHCDEGCGLPHIHRNPPYDTDGRNEMHKKMCHHRVLEPRTPMPLFKDEETDSAPPPPKEEEGLCDLSTEVESCNIGPRRGCEKQDGPGENTGTTKTNDCEEHKNALYGEKDGRGKDTDTQAAIKLEKLK